MRNLFAQMRLRRTAGLFRGLSARRRRPSALPTLTPTRTGADTHWGWGLFAGTCLVALLGLAVILEDDAYLVEMSVQAQNAYYDGYVDGYRRGIGHMRESMADAWHPRALAGETRPDCALPAELASAVERRRARLAALGQGAAETQP